MAARTFLDGRVALYNGDCLDVLPTLDADSFDACVCDPPYHLVSIVKRFGKPNSAPVRVGNINATNDIKAALARQSVGFMGRSWDGGDVSLRVETWQAVVRVLKPGAHLVAFGGTRTAHRMACAIEDAGFEIRDTVMWLYGSGFPKSHDVSKGIDRTLGAERVNGAPRPKIGMNKSRVEMGYRPNEVAQSFDSEPATDAAREWVGFGTALKPAWEPVIIARKPLIGTVAENVLRFGTGALNIDGCRVATDEDLTVKGKGLASASNDGWRRPWMENAETKVFGSTNGRWPANVIHDGSDEVVGLFPETTSGPRNGPSSANEDRIFKLHGGP